MLLILGKISEHFGKTLTGIEMDEHYQKPVKKLKRGSHRWRLNKFIKIKKESNDLLNLRNEEDKV